MAATEKVLLKLEPAELAAIDRVRAAEGVPRTVWIKRLCAAAVLAHDGLALAGSVEAAREALEPAEPTVVPACAGRSPSNEDVARLTGHYAGCRCLKCDAARGVR